jgi:excisionase family DNA binding protein
MHEQMVTLAAVARNLGVPRLVVERLVKSGRLPAYRPGPRLLLIKMSDARAVMEGCRYLPKEAPPCPA